MIYTLEWLKAEADNIQASWDGTNSELSEERRGYAVELEEKVREIEELIKVLGL